MNKPATGDEIDKHFAKRGIHTRKLLKRKEDTIKVGAHQVTEKELYQLIVAVMSKEQFSDIIQRVEARLDIRTGVYPELNKEKKND